MLSFKPMFGITIVLVMTDIEDSTGGWDRNRQAMQQLLEAYVDLVERRLHPPPRIESFTGDGHLLSFPTMDTAATASISKGTVYDRLVDPMTAAIGPMGGGSDDIGDISWNVPTVVLSYPSNISGTPGHNWANAIAMATPIAHKGVVAGAKVQAMTILDLLLHPEAVEAAWKYFKEVQTKETQYNAIIRPTDKPAFFLNKKIMDEYRPRMKTMYYDPSKFDTYLEQLGIKYPTVK